jgi:competence protein ComGC
MLLLYRRYNVVEMAIGLLIVAVLLLVVNGHPSITATAAVVFLLTAFSNI